MKTTYNEALFSKDAGRQLKLLKLLYNSKEGTAIEELTERLGLNRRSIYKSMAELQEVAEKDGLGAKLGFSSRGNYYFTGNKLEYYHLRGSLVEEEPMFLLAQEFLDSPSVSLISFCHKTFLSEGTLKRYLSRANTLLRPFGLRLRLKKEEVVMEGPEQAIRYCLTSFFWKVYNGVKWPFTGLSKTKIESTISALLVSEKEITYGKRQQAAYVLAVYVLRAQSGNCLIRASLPSYSEELTHTSIFPDFVAKVTSNFKLDPLELEFIFLRLHTFPESFNYFNTTANTLDILERKSKASYESISKFLFFVKENHPGFEVFSDKHRYFVDMIVSSRIFVDIFGDVYFNSSSIDIFRYAKKDFPHLLPSIENFLEKQEPQLSRNTLKALTLRYAQAYVMEFSPRDFEPRLTLFLDTDVPTYVDKIMRERLVHFLSPRFNFEWMHRGEKVPDIVIATGVVEKEFQDVPIVYINAEFSQKDAFDLLEVCEVVLSQKQGTILG